MKKTVILILAAMMIMLAAMPAFAGPVAQCVCDGCQGCMRMQTEESVYANVSSFKISSVWDQANNAWQTTYKVCTPMIKKECLVCNHNSAHKVVLKTEKYLKEELVVTTEYPMTPGTDWKF